MKKYLLFLALFASFSASAQYRWTVNGSSSQCTSLESVCSLMKASLEETSIPSNWLNGRFHVVKCQPGPAGFLAYRTGTLPDGRIVGGNDYSNTYGYAVEECSADDPCSSEEGKIFAQLVPLGSIKITDLDKGTYDFQPKDPPKFVCKSGCLVKLEGAGKYWGDSFIDYMNQDENGNYTFAARVEYLGTGKQCTPNDASEGLKEPAEKTDEEKEPDEDKCKAEGGSYGEINGKKVCIGIDNKDKCLSGQTAGYINGKLVCLTPEGVKLPENEEANPGGGDGKDGNGIGGGDQTDGKGTGTDGTGTGDGKGGSGGGSGGGKGNGEGDKEGDGAGPSFGDQPGLYEPRYKNGIKGVWEQKKGQLQNTGLGQLSRRLMPSVNSGSCPSWQLDLILGSGLSFGSHKLQPPCSIWPILRAIVLVCALILARKLVFGG